MAGKLVCGFVLGILLCIPACRPTPPPGTPKTDPKGPLQAHPAPVDAFDLGIAKYEFKASPPAGHVMVVHWQASSPAGAGKTREIVTFNTDHPTVIRVYNPSLFPYATEPPEKMVVTVWVAHTQYRMPAGVTCTDSRSHDDLSLIFSNGERWTFTGSIEPFETVKARIPKLRDASTNSGWSAMYEL